jgi:hypothetical protein
MNNSFAKIKVSTAAAICARFKPKQSPLQAEVGPREFVNALAANRQYLAGLDFMAFALPSREAIWWGCLCLQYATGHDLSESEKAACKAAVKWVLEPTEENRLAAKEPAEKAGQGCPAGGLASACLQTENPWGLPDPARKPSFSTAKSVTGAIKLASTKADPSRIVDTHRLFLELAIGVADGLFSWPEIDKMPQSKN